MRIVSVGLALVIGAAMLTAHAVPATAADDDVSFIGGGFGHGVGMSQYGALGMAQDGATSHEIVQHYYTGTTVGQVASVAPGDDWITGSEALWVGLDDAATSITFRPLGPVAVCIHGYLVECQREEPVAADEQVVVADTGAGCTVSIADTLVYGPGSCAFTIETANDHIEIESMPLRSGNPRRYNNGALEIRPMGTAPPDDEERFDWIINGPFHVTWSTSLETYVAGIDEMPTNWPAAALEAQAIASRSYATSRALVRETGVRATTFMNDPALSSTRAASCWCHLDDGTSDQVYEGWPQDTIPEWTAAASATLGEVTAYGGSVATGYYSSSTSGVTESVETGFGGSPLPYLVSVEDPWSQLPANPFGEWTLTESTTTVAEALGWDTVTHVALDRRPPGAAMSFAGTDGGIDVTTTVTARVMRSLFSAVGVTLRSPGVTDLTGPDPAVPAFGGDFTGDGADELASYDETTGEWSVTTATSHSVWATLDSTTGWEFLPGDYNGDGATDVAAYHEATGRWWMLRSTGATFIIEQWATIGTPTGWEFHPGDYNGDGATDVAAYHEATGRWWIVKSTGTSFVFKLWATFATKSGWEFHPGDFDGNEMTDVAAYHEATGRWWVAESTGTDFTVNRWATYKTRTGWEFLPGDYDADGTTDIAAYHEASGRWWVNRSTGSSFLAELWVTFASKAGWQFVEADVNADGDSDIAAYHENTGRWWAVRSTRSDFVLELWATYEAQFGWTFLPGDYNGDGKDDVLGGRLGFNQAVLASSTGSAYTEVQWR